MNAKCSSDTCLPGEVKKYKIISLVLKKTFFKDFFDIPQTAFSAQGYNIRTSRVFRFMNKLDENVLEMWERHIRKLRVSHKVEGIIRMCIL